MDGFSNIEGSSSDVGVEVNEVETLDVDFGDGDGVNDFDGTYESMNSGDENMEYSQDILEIQEPIENDCENTETAIDTKLNDFDDMDESSEPTEMSDVAPAGDNVEQNLSDMTTDENVDEALSDFEDEDAAGETATEDATDETGEPDTEDVADETGETDVEDTTDESGEADTKELREETGETDADETTESGMNDNQDASSEGENSERSASSIDGFNDGNNEGKDLNTDLERDYTEKNVVFENVSYHQGQNDLGALGTCGPTSIANSLNRVTESIEYTENKVLHNAMDNNLCHKSDNPYSCGGTTTRDVVNIIDNVKNPEDHIHTEVYEYDKALSVDDLANRLDDSGTVAMVGVDSATLWDQRGDVACSGLFQHTESPSDHWITVDSPIRDDAGNVTGFNVIDSGGGVFEVSCDKFEAMYMGDTGHTVSDPTAILITNSGEGGNTYNTSEGVERTSNYKESAEVSDGKDPPTVNLHNTERTSSGAELSPEQMEVNQYFRGDQFKSESSFENTLEDSNKKELINANNATTCGLNENLNGIYQDNAKFSSAVSPEKRSELSELRSRVLEVTEDTVMQKVIKPDQFSEYTRDNSPRTDVSGCASKASDVVPYTNNIEQAYETLRLDYNETVYKEPAENNGDMYVMRFTSDYCPSNSEYPKMDGSETWNKPPCTGTGFTGSGEHLVPEYTYGTGQEISDGAIYKVDAEGNETMVAFWNHGHFEKVQ